MNAFHLSLPCKNVRTTGAFYREKLGASLGRTKDKWVDVNLYGNQITFTQSGTFDFKFKHYRFEQTVLPSFHFGVILDQDTWNKLWDRAQKLNLVEITETSFLRGKAGQHLSFFIKDPNGYYVEFKTFSSESEVFQK